MPTKLDIMNNISPGKWAIVGGKVQRVEEIIPESLIVEKEEKKKVEEKLEKQPPQIKEKPIREKSDKK